MFCQNSGNVQISYVSDGKTAKILFQFLMDQKITWTFFNDISIKLIGTFHSPI